MMFFKLLFHDLLDNKAKRLSALAVAVLTLVLSITLVPGAADSIGKNPQSLSMIIVIQLAAEIAALLILISVLIRFHRTLFSPELYLTLTRPASRTKIIFSKTLAGIIWASVISLIATANSAILFTSLDNAQKVLSSLTESEQMLLTVMYPAEIFESLAEAPGAFIPALIIFSIASSALEISIAQLAITFGALIPRHQKLLAGIGIYFGATYITSYASNILISAATVSMGSFVGDAFKLNEGKV